MPQIFQVLKCYKCETFQVHLTKKSPKWECKMCGEKQSIKRHYGIGTAQECRGHVQKLNTIHGGKNEHVSMIDGDSEEDDYTQPYVELKQDYTRTGNKRVSKWSAFIDESEDVPNVSTEPEYYEGGEVVSELKYKKPKIYKENSKSDFTKTNLSKEPELKKQYNENMTKQSKWLAYTEHEDKSMSTMNESVRSSKNNIPSQITKEFEIDCNLYNKKKNTKLNTNNYLADNENTSNELRYERNLYKNDDPIVLEINKPVQVTGQGQWSQFLKNKEHESSQAPETQTFKSDEHNLVEMEKKLLFSLCDDKDLDSILDF